VLADMTLAIVPMWDFFYNGLPAAGTKIHESLRNRREMSIMQEC